MLTKFNLKGIMTKQRGIGLLELMLALAIIAVLLIMATRYYQSTSQAQKVNQAVSDINAIVAAADAYRSSKPSDTSFDFATLVSAGYLPKAWPDSGKSINPWSGDYTAVLDGSNIKVTATNIPGATCTALADRLSQDAISSDCGGTDVTAVYGSAEGNNP